MLGHPRRLASYIRLAFPLLLYLLHTVITNFIQMSPYTTFTAVNHCTTRYLSVFSLVHYLPLHQILSHSPYALRLILIVPPIPCTFPIFLSKTQPLPPKLLTHPQLASLLFFPVIAPLPHNFFPSLFLPSSC